MAGPQHWFNVFSLETRRHHIEIIVVVTVNSLHCYQPIYSSQIGQVYFTAFIYTHHTGILFAPTVK